MVAGPVCPTAVVLSETTHLFKHPSHVKYRGRSCKFGRLETGVEFNELSKPQGRGVALRIPPTNLTPLYMCYRVLSRVLST